MHCVNACLPVLASQMSEKQFWSKYCTAEIMFQGKNRAVAEAEANEDEELAVFVRDDEHLREVEKKKVRSQWMEW